MTGTRGRNSSVILSNYNSIILSNTQPIFSSFSVPPLLSTSQSLSQSLNEENWCEIFDEVEERLSRSLGSSDYMDISQSTLSQSSRLSFPTPKNNTTTQFHTDLESPSIIVILLLFFSFI